MALGHTLLLQHVRHPTSNCPELLNNFHMLSHLFLDSQITFQSPIFPTIEDATGQMVWRLWADEMQTDANHLQVGGLWGGVFSVRLEFGKGMVNSRNFKNRFVESRCKVILKCIY